MRTELLDKASSSPLYPYPVSYLMRGGGKHYSNYSNKKNQIIWKWNLHSKDSCQSLRVLLWASALGYFERLSMVCYEMYLFMFVSLYISYVSVSKPVDEKK